MGYVIVNPEGRRVNYTDDSGKVVLTPYFDYPIQALRFMEKYLGNSPYFRMRATKGFKRMDDGEFLLKELERIKAKVEKQAEKGKHNYTGRLELIDKVHEFAIDLINFEKGGNYDGN